MGAADEPSPLDGIIDAGAHDVLAADDPVTAEVWASQLLGAFDSAQLQARLSGQDVPPIEEAIVQRCEERGDRNALVVAASLAASCLPRWTTAPGRPPPVPASRPADHHGWMTLAGRCRLAPGWRQR